MNTFSRSLGVTSIYSMSSSSGPWLFFHRNPNRKCRLLLQSRSILILFLVAFIRSSSALNRAFSVCLSSRSLSIKSIPLWTIEVSSTFSNWIPIHVRTRKRYHPHVFCSAKCSVPVSPVWNSSWTINGMFLLGPAIFWLLPCDLKRSPQTMDLQEMYHVWYMSQRLVYLTAYLCLRLCVIST